MLCSDCNDKFCSECFEQQHSSKKKQGHQIIQLNEEYFAKFCLIHQNEKIEFFCFDHKTKLCRICLQEQHKNHNYDSIESVIKFFKQEMEIFQLSKESVQQQKNQMLNVYDEEQKEVHEKFQNLRDKFQFKFDVYKAKKEKIEKDFEEYHQIMKKVENLNSLSFDEIMELKGSLSLQCWDFPLVRHLGIICDQCKTKNFTGNRYKCATCENFDLCGVCHILKGIHDQNHHFIQIKVPIEVDTKIQPHFGISCTKCGVSNFIGYRFKCRNCKSVNLCNNCFKDENYVHQLGCEYIDFIISLEHSIFRIPGVFFVAKANRDLSIFFSTYLLSSEDRKNLLFYIKEFADHNSIPINYTIEFEE